MSERPSPSRPPGLRRRQAAGGAPRGGGRLARRASGRCRAHRKLPAARRRAAQLLPAVLDEPVPERLQRALRPARMRQAALVAAWVALGAALGAIAGWQLHATQPAVAGRAATAPRRWRSARRWRTPPIRRKCAIRWKSAQTRKRTSSPGCRSAWARSCARRSSKPSATTWSAAGCCPATRARWRTSCTSATAARASRSTCAATWVEPLDRVPLRARRHRRRVLLGRQQARLRDLLRDISKEDLLNVANAAYQQLNPP